MNIDTKPSAHTVAGSLVVFAAGDDIVFKLQRIRAPVPLA
jgi:hypothetical protein